MGETSPGLASIVVKLHQTEDPVCRHKLKLVIWVGYNKTEKEKENSAFIFLPSLPFPSTFFCTVTLFI